MRRRARTETNQALAVFHEALTELQDVSAAYRGWFLVDDLLRQVRNWIIETAPWEPVSWLDESQVRFLHRRLAWIRELVVDGEAARIAEAAGRDAT